MQPKLIRQGDVLLRPVAALPPGLKPLESRTLAYGEQTGHAHVVIDGDVFVGEDGKLYVEARHGSQLRHQDQSGAVAEHLSLTLEPGIYEVRTEEDYSPEGLRRVED